MVRNKYQTVFTVLVVLVFNTCLLNIVQVFFQFIYQFYHIVTMTSGTVKLYSLYHLTLHANPETVSGRERNLGTKL